MTQDNTLEIRLGLYSLLAALYRYPLQRETLDLLGSLDAADRSPAARALAELQKTLPETQNASGLESLNVEMTRLMEGPGLTPAPPYASYYMDGRQLMGTAAQAVRRAYLEMQALPEQGSVPPDHVCLELGFLAFLAQRALDIQGEKQADILHTSLVFLREHVRPWLPQFCAALETNSREPFFAALARFTLRILDADQAWLEDLQSPEHSNSSAETVHTEGEPSYEND